MSQVGTDFRNVLRGDYPRPEDVPGLVEKVVAPSPGGYIPGVVFPLTEGAHHHVRKVSEVVPCSQVTVRPWQAASQGSPDRAAGLGSVPGSATAAERGSPRGVDARGPLVVRRRDGTESGAVPVGG